MERLKKCIAATFLATTIMTTAHGEMLQQPCPGYAECRRTPYMTGGAIILGAAALAAMIAVVVTSASCSHSHCD